MNTATIRNMTLGQIYNYLSDKFIKILRLVLFLDIFSTFSEYFSKSGLVSSGYFCISSFLYFSFCIFSMDVAVAYDKHILKYWTINK